MHIDSTEFGSVVIDNKKYNQVLIVGDSIIERDYKKLKDLFGTSHQIGAWEVKELERETPEIIVIATGQDGAMEVDDKIIEDFKNKKIEVITDITPKAVEIYNEKIKQGRRVNALIHTSC